MHRFSGVPLWDVCRDFYFARQLTIRSDKTREQYFYACQDFERSLGHSATVADLCDDSVHVLVNFLQAKHLAPKTVNERAGRIKALWTWLAKRGLVATFPTVGKIPEPRRCPKAWSEEQLAKLFESIEMEDLDVGPIPGRKWWLAWHAIVWNTSERLEATMALRWEWISGKYLHVPAEVRKGKTSDAVYELWDETLETLDDIRLPERFVIFPFPYSWPSTFYNRYERILARVGLPTDRKSKAHRMRVSHATWVRALSGQPAPNLGHASEETTRRHYEDPTICRVPTPKLFIPWKRKLE